MENTSKPTRCPRCGNPSMEIDMAAGKAKCASCGYEIFFKK